MLILLDYCEKMNANYSIATPVSTTAAAMTTRSFKIHFNGDLETRRIPLNEQESFTQVMIRLRQLFGVDFTSEVTVTYPDSDGDMITIGSEEEYKLALALHTQKSTVTLYMFVVPRDDHLTFSPTSNPPPFVPTGDDPNPKYRHPHHHHHHEKRPKKPSARFVMDVTYSEGTKVEPGSTFTKIWRFRNDGETAWPSGVVVKYIGKEGPDQMGGPESVPIGAIVKPNEDVNVSVQLTSPSAPGRYTGFWKLYDPTIEKKFGPRFWVQITVPPASSPVISSSSSDDDKGKKKEVKKELKEMKRHRHGHRHHKDSDEDDKSADKNADKKKEKKEKKEKKSKDSDSSSEEDKPKKVKMSDLLNQLATMGFTDKGNNIKLLKKYDRDLGKVVQALVEKITLDAGGNGTNAITE